jgi:transposase-like protein
MAYQFMKANQNRYAIKETAMLFGVSRSAYYRWARNGASQRRKADDTELIRLILETAAKHHRRYGGPRVRRELRDIYGKRP